MVRTLDADHNAAFEKNYSVSYGGNRAKRRNARTAAPSVTGKRTYGNAGKTRTAGRQGRRAAAAVTTPDRSTRRRTAERTVQKSETTRTRSRGVRVDEASLGASAAEVRVPRSAMSFQTVIVMLALIAVMTVILVFYITLQAEVTNTSQQIANLEQQLTQLKAENDASYNDITDSISLEEVRRRAIHDLGMKYADRDQVVIYSGTEKDTVHQVSSLNDN